MTKSTITREWLQQTIAELESVRDEIPFGIDTNSELELAAFKLALSAMDSEPVVQPVMFIDGDISSDDADKLAKIIREFKEDDERPLAKMARIIRENPHPTNECDMPVAQPTPVVPEEMTPQQASRSYGGEVRGYRDGWNTCRAAMLAAAQPASVVPEIDRKAIADKVYGMCCRIPGATFYNAAEFAIDEVEACRAAMLQAGYSPVIPDGYVMVPKEPTENMVVAGFESEPDEEFSDPRIWEAYQNMSGCQQAAHRARLCWAAMLAAAPLEVK